MLQSSISWTPTKNHTFFKLEYECMYSLLGCSQEWHISTVLLVGQRIHIWPTSQQETGPGNGSQSWYKGPLKKLPFSKARMLPWIPSSLRQLPVSPLWWAQNPSFQNLSPCLQDLGQLAHVSHSPGHLWNLAACLFGMLLPATLRGQRWELGREYNITKSKQQGYISNWHFGCWVHPTTSQNTVLPPQMIHNALQGKGNPSMIQTLVQQSCTPGTRGTSRQLCNHALHSRKQAPESWNQFSTSALPCL